jgi:Icc protein
MRIVQMSDIHVGSGLFRPDLLSAAIEETNSLQPDLVAIVGDLTTEGYRWEFEEAKEYLDGIECENVVVTMGNHDARNVGYRHFEEFFGMREYCHGSDTRGRGEGRGPRLDQAGLGRR